MNTTISKGWASLASVAGSVARARGMRMTMRLAFVAVAASCTENVTAPPVSDAPANPVTVAPTAETAVLHRTIEMDPVGGSGPRLVRRQTIVQRLGEDVDRQPDPRPGAERISSAEEVSSPTMVLSLPANLMGSSCGGEAAWTRTQRNDAFPGAIVVATGAGDAPATLIRVVRDGKTIATVARSWVRMARSWELTRQETTMPARNYRDLVEVERRAPTGTAPWSSLPSLSCTAKDSATRARLDEAIHPLGLNPSSSARTSVLAAPAPRRIEECVSDGNDDECADQRDRLHAADIAVVVASINVALSCSLPNPFKIDQCAKSVTAYLATVALDKIAQRALARCIAEQEAKKKACYCAGGTAMESRADAPGSHRALPRLALEPLGASHYIDCSSSDDGSGLSDHEFQEVFGIESPTPEYPGPTSSGETYHLCVYEVDYDIDTNEFHLYPLYCYYTNMT